MANDPPYIPGLPPGIAQDFLNQWHNTLNRPTPNRLPPFVNQVPPPGPPPVNNPNADPIEGTWVSSGGSWRFVKDGQGYRFEETSLLGTTGVGRAAFENGSVHIDYNSSFLGHITCTLAVSGNVMQGNLSMWGSTVPIYLQRA
jgi:hypothetical protein